MTGSSGIDRIIDRIRSIESRIESISYDFNGPPKSTAKGFKELLSSSRQKHGLTPIYPSIDEGSGENSRTSDLIDMLGNTASSEKTPQWLEDICMRAPNKIIKFDGYNMQAELASKFARLKSVIGNSFTGRAIDITSTMGGSHTSPAHPDGRAIDFVVEGLTAEESGQVEKMALECGLKAFNEYKNDSPKKTGPHMHIEI